MPLPILAYITCHKKPHNNACARARAVGSRKTIFEGKNATSLTHSLTHSLTNSSFFFATCVCMQGHCRRSKLLSFFQLGDHPWRPHCRHTAFSGVDNRTFKQYEVCARGMFSLWMDRNIIPREDKDKSGGISTAKWGIGNRVQ